MCIKYLCFPKILQDVKITIMILIVVFVYIILPEKTIHLFKEYEIPILKMILF